jgi:hypothetical protein
VRGILMRHFITKSIRSNESSSQRQRRLKEGGGEGLEQSVRVSEEEAALVNLATKAWGGEETGDRSRKKRWALASRVELGPVVQVLGKRGRQERPKASPTCRC